MMKAGPMTTNQRKNFLQDYIEWKDAYEETGYRNKYQDYVIDALLEIEKQKIASAINAQLIQQKKELIDSLGEKDTMSKQEVSKEMTFSDFERKQISVLKEGAHHAYSVMDSEFVTYFPSSSIVIAGGCFASWFHGQPPKDIDVFVLNDPESRGTFAETLRMSIGPRLKDKTDAYVRGAKHVQRLFEWVPEILRDPVKYQFIFTDYKSREELIADFDMAHCMVSYHVGKLYLTRRTFDAIKEKNLILNKGKEVPSWRIDKFTQRGWVLDTNNVRKDPHTLIYKRSA